MYLEVILYMHDKAVHCSSNYIISPFYQLPTFNSIVPNLCVRTPLTCPSCCPPHGLRGPVCFSFPSVCFRGLPYWLSRCLRLHQKSINSGFTPPVFCWRQQLISLLNPRSLGSLEETQEALLYFPQVIPICQRLFEGQILLLRPKIKPFQGFYHLQCLNSFLTLTLNFVRLCPRNTCNQGCVFPTNSLFV